MFWVSVEGKGPLLSCLVFAGAEIVVRTDPGESSAGQVHQSKRNGVVNPSDSPPPQLVMTNDACAGGVTKGLDEGAVNVETTVEDAERVVRGVESILMATPKI
jgi:hypothetical protein